MYRRARSGVQPLTTTGVPSTARAASHDTTALSIRIQPCERARIVNRYPDVGVLGERLAAVEEALRRRSDDALLGSKPTPAELRLLELLPTDLTLKEIASQHLYVSIHTVTSHARRLYRRLGARTREEAVVAARERGLL